MSFKSQLEDDIFAVFLNGDEFGEKGEIAGHEAAPMLVEALELEMPPAASDERPGLTYEGVAVYVAESDVPENLLVNRKTTFRHEEWFVLACASDGGLKKISLYRERA